MPSSRRYAYLSVPVNIIINDGFFIFWVSILDAKLFKVLTPSEINLYPPNLISTKPYSPLRKWITASHSKPEASYLTGIKPWYNVGAWAITLSL